MKIIAAWAFIGLLVAADLVWLAIVIVVLWFLVVILNYVTNPQLSEGRGFNSNTWSSQESQESGAMTRIENMSTYKSYDEIGCCVEVYGETMHLWFSTKVEVLGFFRDDFFLFCDARNTQFHHEYMSNENDIESKRAELENSGEEMNNAEREMLQYEINDLESRIGKYEEKSHLRVELDDMTLGMFDALISDEKVSMTKISNLVIKTFPESVGFVGTFSSVCTGQKGMGDLRESYRESRGMRISNGPLSKTHIEDFKNFLCEPNFQHDS